MYTPDWTEHVAGDGQAGTVPPPPPWSKREATLPPPPPRAFRVDAPPSASPRAGAPAGVLARIAGYWRQSSPRRKLVITLAAVAFIAALAAAGLSGRGGYNAAESAFLSQCGGAGYSQSMFQCALTTVEQALSPSVFDEAMTAQSTAYEGEFNAAERSCGM